MNNTYHNDPDSTIEVQTFTPLHYAVYARHNRPDVETAADDHFSTHTTIATSIRSKVKRKASIASVRAIKHYGRVEGKLDAKTKKHKEKRRQRINKFRALVGLKPKTTLPARSIVETSRTTIVENPVNILKAATTRRSSV